LKQVKWSVLIATIGQREDRFLALLKTLLPQTEGKEIEVVAYWNNGERPLAEIRQSLVEFAKGEYVSFIDDDDQVPAYYCEKIYPLLDGVDYIGWRMQVWSNGEKLKPTFHSLKYTHWYDDNEGFYRNVSHLNPIKRNLALEAGFVAENEVAEDQPWAERAAKLAKTEHFIKDVMYYYQHTTQDSVWRGRKDLELIRTYVRPEVRHDNFCWHPESREKFNPFQR
jgi:hypothetical protein